MRTMGRTPTPARTAKKKKGARDPKRGRPYPLTKKSAQEVLHFVWHAVAPHLPQGHFSPTHCVAQHLSLQHLVAQEEAVLLQVAQPLKSVAPMTSARNIVFIGVFDRAARRTFKIRCRTWPKLL